AGQQPLYTFTAATGDAVSIRVASTTSGFSVTLDLLDPQGQEISSDSTSIVKTLTQAGTYTVRVRTSGGAPPGNYELFRQMTKNPCNATALTCGTVQAGRTDKRVEVG